MTIVFKCTTKSRMLAVRNTNHIQVRLPCAMVCYLHIQFEVLCLIPSLRFGFNRLMLTIGTGISDILSHILRSMSISCILSRLVNSERREERLLSIIDKCCGALVQIKAPRRSLVQWASPESLDIIFACVVTVAPSDVMAKCLELAAGANSTSYAQWMVLLRSRLKGVRKDGIYRSTGSDTTKPSGCGV